MCLVQRGKIDVSFEFHLALELSLAEQADFVRSVSEIDGGCSRSRTRRWNSCRRRGDGSDTCGRLGRADKCQHRFEKVDRS